jgi:thioredoxin-dependent peroxiredoxin
MKMFGIICGLMVLAGVILFAVSRLTAAELKVGDAAPDFKLQGSDGKTYSLADYRGKQAVVLAWFPKAFTPGCTAECKALAAGGAKLKAFEAAYFTASVDPPEKNKEFAQSVAADYPILSDPSGETARAYGVTDAVKKFPSRWTFYIGADGKILYIDKNVNTADSAAQVAKKLEELGVKHKDQKTSPQAKDKAVSRLTQLGGQLFYDGAGDVVGVLFSDVIFHDDDFGSFASFPKLQSLSLMDCKASDKILDQIHGINSLEELTLWGTQITDEGMKQLKDLIKLRKLDIHATKIGDAGLQNIAGFKSLQFLNLLGTKITDNGCAHLKNLTQLRELSLVQTQVGDRGIEQLTELRNLRKLEMEDTKITDVGLRFIAQSQELELLSLHRTGVTDEGLRHLKSLKKLTTLYLVDLPITDKGLANLQGLTNLRYLYIGLNPGVTEEGERKLKACNPEIGIY